MVSLPKGRKAAAVLAASTSVVSGLAYFAAPASATPSTLVTITGVSTHYVPALSAKQVITVTGTGFDESVISNVTISGCSTTANNTTTLDPLTYVVTSPTTLVVKTTANCAAGTSNTVEITATDGPADSNPAAAAMALAFVTPPNLASSNPVVELNSATTGPVATAPVTGGTTIKVIAGTSQFLSTSTQPLTASLGGNALTVTPHYVSGTSGAVDYFTAKTPAHAAGAVNLVVGSAGITTTFANPGFSYAGTTLTSVTPNYGPSDGGGTITVAGAGFVYGAQSGNSTVTICGKPATVTTGSTATALKVTVPAVVPGNSSPTFTGGAVDGVCTVQVTTGSLTSIVNQNSTYTYVAQG